MKAKAKYSPIKIKWNNQIWVIDSNIRTYPAEFISIYGAHLDIIDKPKKVKTDQVTDQANDQATDQANELQITNIEVS